MRTVSIADQTADWPSIVAEVQHGAEPIGLELDGTLCGLLLPSQEALRIAARYAPPPPMAARSRTPPPASARTYLELLRDDPTLVPQIDGQPLEFLTMMNSSYVDPQQIYQFRHPKTRQIYVYRAGELQQAIGRTFSQVEFIPQRPKDFVERKA